MADSNSGAVLGLYVLIAGLPRSGDEELAFAAVIHFGKDDCQRVQALRHVGYKVRESDSLNRLLLDLQRDEEVDAVIVSEAEPNRAEQAAVVVRQFSGAPLILFRRPDVALDESRFDRVYSWSVPPAHWLFDTAVVVMQSKGLRADSERMRTKSEAVRNRSRRSRARAAAELSRKLPPAWAAPEEAETA